MGLLDRMVKLDQEERFLLLIERIATALERIAGPDGIKEPIPTLRGPETLINYGENESQWTREQITTAVKAQGLSPEEEKQIIEEMLQDDEEDLRRP